MSSLRRRLPVPLLKPSSLLWRGTFFHSTYYHLWLSLCLLFTSHPHPSQTRSSMVLSPLYSFSGSGTTGQHLTQNGWFKNYFLNELIAMKGLVPRVNRLNIGLKERGAGLGSLFQENTSWLPEVYEAIFLCVFSPSLPPSTTPLKTTSGRLPSGKVLRCRSTVLYPICTSECLKRASRGL